MTKPLQFTFTFTHNNHHLQTILETTCNAIKEFENILAINTDPSRQVAGSISK